MAVLASGSSTRLGRGSSALNSSTIQVEKPNMSFTRVSVVGLGYIGLPTAAVLAASGGVDVVGVDVDPRVVETVNRGNIHIVEPLLHAIVEAAVGSGRLKAALKPEPCDAFLIAVPTPVAENKSADLRHVFAAADAISEVLKPGDLVVLESTSPMGTTEKLAARLAERRPDLSFPGISAAPNINVAYCPERVLPGRVIEELVSNDRAIGGITPVCTERAQALYGLFVKGELVPTSSKVAELCKLSENAFRDVNIAYANELANVCGLHGVSVSEVIAISNRHPRVNILNPGPGVGGHCIAVDPWFIVESAPEDTPLIRAARFVNDQRPHKVVAEVTAKIRQHAHPTIACLGLSFKPDIDDIRESPAVEVTRLLAEAHPGRVLVVEPHIASLPETFTRRGVRQVELAEALRRADILVILVDHAVFKAERETIAKASLIVDPRGMLEVRP